MKLYEIEINLPNFEVFAKICSKNSKIPKYAIIYILNKILYLKSLRHETYFGIN